MNSWRRLKWKMAASEFPRKMRQKEAKNETSSPAQSLHFPSPENSKFTHSAAKIPQNESFPKKLHFFFIFCLTNPGNPA